MIIDFLFKIGLKINFGKLTPVLKIIASYIRYYIIILKTKNEKKSIIFIAGLPKSGTTWLENMLTINGSFTTIMPPEVTIWEQRYSRSDNYLPNSDIFKALPNGRWVVKLHCQFSEYLYEILKKNNIKPIVIFRNLDKVFDSHLHYVLNTKFHPDYNSLKKITNRETQISWIKDKYEEDFEKWILNWKKQKDVHILTYEKLLNNTFEEISKIMNFLEIRISKEKINKLIISNSIKELKSKSVHKSFYRGSQVK